MPIISIAVILLVILCTLYFLAKVKAENLGPLFKWTAYLVLLVAAGLLVFQLARGCSKVWHRKMCSDTECGSGMHQQKMMGKSMGHGGKNNSCCCAEMDCTDHCNMQGMDDCCMDGKMMKKRMKMDDEPGVIRESSVDTVDGKIIMKETEIIERKK